MTPKRPYSEGDPANWEDREVKVMEDVAVLKSQMRSLHEWQRETDRHDDRQDKALFTLEKRADRLEMLFAQFAKDDREEKKKAARFRKAALSLLFAVVSEFGSYDVWQYWGKSIGLEHDFIYRVGTGVMVFLIILGATFLIPWQKMNKKEE